MAQVARIWKMAPRSKPKGLLPSQGTLVPYAPRENQLDRGDCDAQSDEIDLIEVVVLVYTACRLAADKLKRVRGMTIVGLGSPWGVPLLRVA